MDKIPNARNKRNITIYISFKGNNHLSKQDANNLIILKEDVIKNIYNEYRSNEMKEMMEKTKKNFQSRISIIKNNTKKRRRLPRQNDCSSVRNNHYGYRDRIEEAARSREIYYHDSRSNGYNCTGRINDVHYHNNRFC